jgi:hypothetical protein
MSSKDTSKKNKNYCKQTKLSIKREMYEKKDLLNDYTKEEIAEFRFQLAARAPTIKRMVHSKEDGLL